MGRTPRRWPMLRRALRQAEQMDKLMRALGVDEVKAARLDHGTAIKKAREACLHCAAPCQCLQFLEDLERTEQIPSFCVNARFFEQCRTRAKQNDSKE